MCGICAALTPPGRWSREDIRLRPAEPADRPAVLALLAEVFGASGVLHRPEFFAWKHDSNPFGPSPLWLAEAGGRVVAVRAFLRWRLRSGTKTVDAVRAVDTATLPDFRGQGLFRRLTLALAEDLEHRGVALVFNTPNRFSRPGYLSMGWRKVGRVPVWIRPLRPLAFVRALLTGPQPPRETPTDGAGEVTGGAVDAELAELLAHPRLEGLLDRSGDDRWHTHRDRAYLRWRYGEIPGGLPDLAYRATVDRDGEQPAAVVYRNRRRGRWRELDVAEILARPGESRRAGRLLRRCLAREASRGAHHALACAARGTPQARALLRAGFVPLPAAGPWLTWRPLAWPGGLARPDSWARWRVEWGDLELF